MVRLRFDAMIGRFSYDKDFLMAVVENPRKTLGEAGMLLDRGEVEAFMKKNPKEFDQVGDAMIKTLDKDIFAALGAAASSCA